MSDPVPLVEETSKSTVKNEEEKKPEEEEVEKEPEIETATRIRDRV